MTATVSVWRVRAQAGSGSPRGQPSSPGSSEPEIARRWKCRRTLAIRSDAQQQCMSSSSGYNRSDKTESASSFSPSCADRLSSMRICSSRASSSFTQLRVSAVASSPPRSSVPSSTARRSGRATNLHRVLCQGAREDANVLASPCRPLSVPSSPQSAYDSPVSAGVPRTVSPPHVCSSYRLMQRRRHSFEASSRDGLDADSRAGRNKLIFPVAVDLFEGTPRQARGGSCRATKKAEVTLRRIAALFEPLIAILLRLAVFMSVTTSVVAAVSHSTLLPQPMHVLMATSSFHEHALPLGRLAAELISRKHNVSVVTDSMDVRHLFPDGVEFYVPPPSRSSSNGASATGVGTGGASGIELDGHTMNEWRSTQMIHHFYGIHALVSSVYTSHYSDMFDLASAIILKDRPDVVVADIAAFGATDAAALHSVPFLYNNPSLPLFGLPPSAELTAGVWELLPLSDRCLAMFYKQITSIFLSSGLRTLNQLRIAKGAPQVVREEDLHKNALVVTNSAFGFEFPTIVSPLQYMSGPFVPRQPLYGSLPASLTDWLDSSHGPVIAIVFPPNSIAWGGPETVTKLHSVFSLAPFTGRSRIVWILRSEMRKYLGASLPSHYKVYVSFFYLFFMF